jgi:deazaflavin-dependent oxidoreductase (nitroreductase family)
MGGNIGKLLEGLVIFFAHLSIGGEVMNLVLVNGQRRRLLSPVLGLILFSCLPTKLLAQENKSPTRADLEKVADQSTVELTTIGRKSGKPHTKPIWFVYDQGRLYLQSGGEGKTDWYLNLKKNPQMTLKIGTVTFTGRAKFIDDPKETERIHGLFRTKYLRARIAGAVGLSIGHGKAVEVELL